MSKGPEITRECIAEDLKDEAYKDEEFVRAVQVGDKQTTPIIDEDALAQVERFGTKYKDVP
jgi:hypothetical protein